MVESLTRVRKTVAASIGIWLFLSKILPLIVMLFCANDATLKKNDRIKMYFFFINKKFAVNDLKINSELSSLFLDSVITT